MKQLAHTFIGAPEGVWISAFGRIMWTGKADIDADGSGSSHGDPDFQPDTTLHIHGKALNADTVPYIVVPPAVRDAARGIVMGCAATVTYRGKAVMAVVGDIGPHDKIGEISVCLAEKLGINPSPVNGGVPDGVDYCIYPGETVTLDGITYPLQPA